MEWLKELIGEELYNPVMAKLGDKKLLLNDGSFIPKSRLDEVISQREASKGQIEEMSKKFADLEKSAKGNEELLKQLDELKRGNETLTQKNNEISLNSAIKLAAIQAKAKDPSDILSFIDKSKLKLDGDAVLGLDDALKGLKEGKAYLFDDATAGATGTGGNPSASNSNLGAKEDTVRNEFRNALGV